MYIDVVYKQTFQSILITVYNVKCVSKTNNNHNYHRYVNEF